MGFELNKDFWLNINDDDLLKRKNYDLYYFLAEYCSTEVFFHFYVFDFVVTNYSIAVENLTFRIEGHLLKFRRDH